MHVIFIINVINLMKFHIVRKKYVLFAADIYKCILILAYQQKNFEKKII